LLSFTVHMSIGFSTIAGLVPFGLSFTNSTTFLLIMSFVYTIGVCNKMVLTWHSPFLSYLLFYDTTTPLSSIHNPGWIQSSFPSSGCAAKYLCYHIQLPVSASSLSRLRSSQRNNPFMPRVRTTLAHTRSFSSIGPLLLNHLTPPVRSFIISVLVFSFLPRLESYLFPGSEMHWKQWCSNRGFSRFKEPGPRPLRASDRESRETTNEHKS